jgi:hypothetical protein
MRQVRAAVARLPSAATPAELMADAAVMGGAVTVAARDVSRLLASLGRAAADSRAGLQRAFGAAPACQHLPRTP